MRVLRSAAVLAGLLHFSGPSATAQTDYRNLDAGHPVSTEDTYPVERYAFELMAAYRFEAAPGGGREHTAAPELVYGLARNAELGLELPLGAVDQATGTEWGLAGIRVFGLYNLNTEGRSVPAISLRGDAVFPVGSLGGEATRFAVKVIATRSWGRLRAHVNAARGFGSENGISVMEPLHRWRASLAADWTLLRSSLLLIGEVATAQRVEDGPSEVNASLGSRWQWTPTLVLDLGLTRRLSDLGADFGITLGVSHVFAIGALLPGSVR